MGGRRANKTAGMRKFACPSPQRAYSNRGNGVERLSSPIERIESGEIKESKNKLPWGGRLK
jgi:hypothetical protein